MKRIPGGIIIVLSLMLWTACRPAAAPVSVSNVPISINGRPTTNLPMPPSKPMEEMSWNRIDGAKEKLKDLQGKAVILDFWATYCPPCIEETPSLNALAKEYGPKGVVVLGVSIDKNEQKYKKFLDRFGIQFPMTRDADHKLADIYGTYQFPETYIIDRNGKVVQKVISNTNWNGPEIKIFLDNLLRS